MNSIDNVKEFYILFYYRWDDLITQSYIQEYVKSFITIEEAVSYFFIYYHEKLKEDIDFCAQDYNYLAIPDKSNPDLKLRIYLPDNELDDLEHKPNYFAKITKGTKPKNSESLFIVLFHRPDEYGGDDISAFEGYFNSIEKAITYYYEHCYERLKVAIEYLIYNQCDSSSTKPKLYLPSDSLPNSHDKGFLPYFVEIREEILS